mmetsp:Transcript_26298/g.55919  ORF Transcript_26298/g.55919 Transcript_26298/m.55919 type:complete len:241 (-) Transcript_26298:161-883(-)
MKYSLSLPASSSASFSVSSLFLASTFQTFKFIADMWHLSHECPGLCTGWTQMAETWPTEEMLGRGTPTTFYAGFPIAFFSGLGVALSVLDDQTSSLVGVAISASLLPPAVNCGMLFVVAFIQGDDWSNFSWRGSSTSFPRMGVLSLLLTVANVVMVALGAALMFRVKEVLPVKKKVFWDDLKIARRLYQGRAVDSVTGEALNFEECAKIALEISEEQRGTITSKHSYDPINTPPMSPQIN